MVTWVTRVTDWPAGQPLRTAAIGGLTFTVLYVVHRLLQGTGPDSSGAAAVAAYQPAAVLALDQLEGGV